METDSNISGKNIERIKDKTVMIVSNNNDNKTHVIQIIIFIYLPSSSSSVSLFAFFVFLCLLRPRDADFFTAAFFGLKLQTVFNIHTHKHWQKI